MSEIDTSTEAIAAPMADLKPCPFCGGEAEIDDFLAGGISTGHWAVRPGCGSRGEVLEAEVEAIAAWNTRATPPEVTAMVEAATALRDQIARWHAGGPAAGPEESRALFEALDEALREWEASNA